MYEACQNSSGICADLKDLSILIVKIWALGEDFNLSKFSAPTIAFLAFWLAKKLRLWANSPILRHMENSAPSSLSGRFVKLWK